MSAWPVGVSLAGLLATAVLPRWGWRTLFLSGATALLGALYVYRFVPESPLWLPTYLLQERGLAPSGMSLYVLALNAGMFCGYPLHAWLAGRFGNPSCCFCAAP